MGQTNHLKRKFIFALGATAITFLAATTATFAWYIYNTERHTTNVHMAAGSGASLEISNAEDGPYSYAAVLDSFVGTLNPVSTNRITDGFQKVYGFTDGSENQPNLVASIFGAGETSDYYQTSLYLRTRGNMQVYLSDIGYQNDDKKIENDENFLISTAIRVGIVTHDTTPEKNVTGQYIFEINQEKNPQAEYNTATGEEGHVLNASLKDGSTIAFAPYNASNFCSFDSETGKVTLSSTSLPLCKISGTEDGNYGEPILVDVYIWLEGCDSDCTNNLCAMTLSNLSLSFVGYTDSQNE